MTDMSTLTLILGAPDPEMIAIEELGHQVGAEIRYALSARGVRVRADEAYQTVGIAARLHMDRRSMDAPLPPGTVYAVECDGPAIPADAIRIDHHRPGDPGYGRPPAEFLPASSIGQVISLLFGPSGYDRYEPDDWIEIIGDAGYRDDYALDKTWSMCLVAGGEFKPLPLDSSEVEAVERSEKDWFALIPGYGWGIKTYTTGCEDGSGNWRYLIIPAEYVLCAAADHCLAAAYRGECPGVDPDALMRWRVESRAEG